MNITLQKLGRRFNQEWIFRGIDLTFYSNKKYAILGPNGSGKSTLIKVLSGQLTPSEGLITYTLQDQKIHSDDIYAEVSIAAPYVELIEEFTLLEMIDFHFKFKDYLPGFDAERLIEILGMQKSKNKEVKYFSSGMKQRVKLVLACCSRSSILFLDEPTSNLDTEGEQFYLDLVAMTDHQERILIVGSNQEKEYGFCESRISIMDYK